MTAGVLIDNDSRIVAFIFMNDTKLFDSKKSLMLCYCYFYCCKTLLGWGFVGQTFLLWVVRGSLKQTRLPLKSLIKIWAKVLFSSKVMCHHRPKVKRGSKSSEMVGTEINILLYWKWCSTVLDLGAKNGPENEWRQRYLRAAQCMLWWRVSKQNCDHTTRW